MGKTGKGSKISGTVLSFVNLGIFVFTILSYILGLSLIRDLNSADEGGEVLGLVIVFICFAGLPILFSLVNIGLGIPAIITSSVSVKRSEKKGLPIACLVITGVIILTVVILFIALYIPNVGSIGNAQ